jgi:hypothetical protein
VDTQFPQKRWLTSSFTQGKYPQNMYNCQVINLVLGFHDVPFSKKMALKI